MRVFFVAWLLAAGCVQSNAVICADGRVCPPDAVCDDVRHKCVLPTGCGDLVVTGSEQCDGTVAEDKDQCSEHDYQNDGIVTCNDDCTLNLSACAGTCGDGIINGDEKCDYEGQQLDGKDCTSFGFYSADGLACSDACTFDVSACSDRCGDGTRNGPEACDGTDLGNTTCSDLGFYSPGGLACTAGCSFDTLACSGFCGDRTMTPSREICDSKLERGQSCTTFGFDQGALECSTVCAPDTAACRSPEQEPWPTVLVADAAMFEDVWGSSPSNLFAVGCAGEESCTGAVVARFDGTSWTAQTGIGGSYLRAVWGADANNVFAVGDDGVIIGFNGSQWAPMVSGTTTILHDVWGTATNNVIAVGERGTVLRYNGSNWAPITPAFPNDQDQLMGIWGTSATNFYVVGWPGRIWHFNGTWNQITTNTMVALTDIWGASASEIYVVGYSGTILFFNGSQWTPMTSGTSTHFRAVTGTGSGDVYATNATNHVRHYDGLSWRQLGAASRLVIGIGSVGTRDVYAVGTAGAVARFTGDGWARRQNLTDETSAMIHDAGDAIIGVNANRIVEMPGGELPIGSLLGVGGNGNNVFAVGFNGLIYKRTAPMTWQPVTSPTTNALYDIGWPFAVGPGVVLRYSGGSWTPMTPPTTGVIRRVWAASPTEAYAVGGLGNVYRLTGDTWTAIAKPTNNLVWAVWGSSMTDVFVAADEGEIHHYNGSTWRKMTVPTADALFEIDGTGPADVYATSRTAVYHYDGLTWSPIKAPITDGLSSIDGPLFAGGDTSVIERRRHCTATETTCNDDHDDDCDGYYDCGDSDCAANAACSTGGLCSTATALACNTTMTGNTSLGASTLTRYACDPWAEHGPELVYKYTATATGMVTLALTAARDLDLVVLAQGAGGGCEPRNPGCIAASSKAGGAETVSFAVTQGQTYYVAVDGIGAAAGAFSLAVTCP